ncbi:unnamed protein product [Lathyrus sativus]|nr:unnamed protein product [Lathyrus sativus]
MSFYLPLDNEDPDNNDTNRKMDKEVESSGGAHEMESQLISQPQTTKAERGSYHHAFHHWEKKEYARIKYIFILLIN